MAKKVYSFSLSSEAHKEILRVRKEHNYDSDSAALEAILLRRDITDDRLKRLILEVLKDNQISVTDAREPVTLIQSADEKVQKALEDAMNDIMNNMGD